ncbi:hypothetical protein [Aurantiacibacter sp. D1-12]|uniref:hypothetical protein n=1 Tax=Aurantiacibacter sp. D1-12 TaxID=2993658 RepID=UPI00237C88A3|nr:hypothetical protein [Aurantiacibacter sp. D1-12]MDE1466263.1 hypothetical protein [Aurantiacibacter sp. D1-12]
MSEAILKAVFAWLPVIFGIGFIAPLIMQLLAYQQLTAVGGIPAIWIGLGIGFVWGSYAKIRGRWI